MEYFKGWLVALVAGMKFELPGTWQFEEYTLDQFRSFWKSLLAQCLAHIQAHEHADEAVATRGGAIGSLVIQASEESLMKVGAIFPLPEIALRSIVDTLVYRPTADYWDPFWQPVIRISDGTLLIAPHLITTGSPERNLMTLMTRSATGRAYYDKVSTEKEQLQLNALLRLFALPRYKSRTRVMVPRGDGTILTDIDLLLYDNENDLLLLVHAKWFIRPDTIQEHLAREQESKSALEVAALAVSRVAELGERWISRTLGIELKHLPKLRSIVVCRDFVHSGFVDDQHIPVISELYFTKFVESSEFNGLASLYEACEGFTAAVDKLHSVKVGDREIQIGEYVFELPGMEFDPGDPSTTSANAVRRTQG
jgi:hypothetical protein